MSGMGQYLLLRILGALLLLTTVLPLLGQSDRTYVGSQTCARCHTEVHRQWAESLHSRMMQPATDLSVKGDFSFGKLTLAGTAYLLQHRNGKYYITESSISGKPSEHRVDYTLGSHRVQHYLTTLPDGRIVGLGTASQKQGGTLDPLRILVVLNWFEELKARVPNIKAR